MGAGEVRVVVARGEAERVRLDPGHGEWEGSIRLLARPGVYPAAVFVAAVYVCARARSSSSSVPTPSAFSASFASSRPTAGPTAAASGAASSTAFTGSKKKVRAPSGVSSTARRPLLMWV